MLTAEMRAPGQRPSNRFEDSGDEYDAELHGGNFGGRSGRIILLGNGTEVLTESDEQEVFDHEDDDRDLENQVSRGDANAVGGNGELRNQRHETPGPPSQESRSQHDTPGPIETGNPFDTPSSTTSERSESTETIPIKTVPENALPEKLVTPPTSKDK